jgi:two-component system chemotaxis sensor kinase CheA
MSLDLRKYADLFLSEAREHVVEMNLALGTLETNMSDDAVASLFRAVHSIKGMAAAMQYTTVSEHAHALENVLDDVRTGMQRMTSSLVAYLYEQTDVLAREIEGVARVGTPRREVTSRYIRIDAARLDALMDLTGELEIARGRLESLMSDADDESMQSSITHISRVISDLRDQVLTTRMVPVGQVFERLPSLARETARGLGKEVNFTVEGNDIELDRSMLDAIGDPLLHVLRNAIDHGLESTMERKAAGKPPAGRVTLSAYRESGCVLLCVADDGRGIDRQRVLDRARASQLVSATVTELSDAELLNVLVHPGFSTADTVSNVSGRGVGLDVVDSVARSLGGTLELRSAAGCGTAITLRLPLTVAIVRALLARVGDEIYALPVTHIHETLELDPVSMFVSGDRIEATVRQNRLPVLSLRQIVGLPANDVAFPKAVTVEVRGCRAALIVDEFVGQQEIVVKQFTPLRNMPVLFSGATILHDGVPALIVDINSLIERSVY